MSILQIVHVNRIIETARVLSKLSPFYTIKFLTYTKKTSLVDFYRKVPTVTPIETKRKIVWSKLEGESYGYETRVCGVGKVQSCSPYGERDGDVPARHMASGTGRSSSPSQLAIWPVGPWRPRSPYVEREEVKIEFWLSSGDSYGRGMMVVLLPISLLVSRRSSFDNFLCNSCFRFIRSFKHWFSNSFV